MWVEFVDRTMSAPIPSRRPIRTRDTRWAAGIARWLSGRGIRPNWISVASVLFAAGAGVALYLSGLQERGAGAALLLVGAALLIQGRLLCNLFDGMVAVEGGFRTKSGEIFNELPDRFADAFILVGAGYAAVVVSAMPVLGWSAAVLSVITAYKRALGVAAGASQQFCGPMAKQQRMAVITVACVAEAALAWAGNSLPVFEAALALIAAGCLVTIFRRAGRIIRELEG